jgi:alanine racemase
MKSAELSKIIGAKNAVREVDLDFTHILTDSRLLVDAEKTVFFALKGEKTNGQLFIPMLVDAGVKVFIVEEKLNFENEEIIEFCVVNTVDALQRLAAWHRNQFHFPVIGITGSNGKTTVKEWICALASDQFSVIKSPKSYNSQIGVPISVWNMRSYHDLAIIETGISKKGEMEKLERIVSPDIGLFTNIGQAHEEGFDSVEDKIKEKAKLFIHSKKVIFCLDHLLITKEIGFRTHLIPVSWSLENPSARYYFQKNDAGYTILIEGKPESFQFPFSLNIWIENAIHAIVACLEFGVSPVNIRKNLNLLRPLPMRLEIKRAINGCYLIDDTYSNDLTGLYAALDFQKLQKQNTKKTIILSDLMGSGQSDVDLYQSVAEALSQYKIQRLIGIGASIERCSTFFKMEKVFFPDVKSFFAEFPIFTHEMILIKGARKIDLSPIVKQLQEKHHQTVLEVNFESLIHNYNVYKSKLNPNTKLMVMLKAFGYGGGGLEIANLLQFHQADYIGVAYVDEAIELRRNGITIPIMVMNPDPAEFELMSVFNIEAEIYHLDMLKILLNAHFQYPSVHLKIETGMNRLGFSQNDIGELIHLLQQNPDLKIKGIFTHLAASDSLVHDAFTYLQINLFNEIYDKLCRAIEYFPMRHILNSSGMIRFPRYQFEMVRLGIGLHGYDPVNQLNLKFVSTLKSIVSQIKYVAPGESIGYSRNKMANSTLKIAVIPIGYADGYHRVYGNGVGWVSIQNKLWKTVGNICMDMMMVDVTGGEINPGDEVILFGKNPTILDLAKWSNSIPYEVLTNISQRVKRVFISE